MGQIQDLSVFQIIRKIPNRMQVVLHIVCLKFACSVTVCDRMDLSEICRCCSGGLSNIFYSVFTTFVVIGWFLELFVPVL